MGDGVAKMETPAFMTLLVNATFNPANRSLFYKKDYILYYFVI